MLFVEISAQVVAQEDGPYYRKWPDVGMLLERKRSQQLGRFDLRIIDERRHGYATSAQVDGRRGRKERWGKKPAYSGVIDDVDGPDCQAEIWLQNERKDYSRMRQ